MNIVAPVLIPIFYWKEDLDSFLAANGVKSFLGKNPAQVVPVSQGDSITELDGKYPIFVGVRFNEMEAMPDVGGAMNCVIVSRYDQSETILADWTKLPVQERLPVKARAMSKKAMRWKVVFNDYEALTRMGYEVMSNAQRAVEVMPLFVKHLVEIFEKKEPNEDDEWLVAGTTNHPTVLASDYPTFESEVIKPYADPRSRPALVTGLAETGRKIIDHERDKLVQLAIARNATLSEFAGHQVKIAHMPSELAHRAGWALAKNMPFGVVFEDILKENKRIYRLYSARGGLNVLEIGAPFNAEGNARYASFTVEMDFSSHKFI